MSLCKWISPGLLLTLIACAEPPIDEMRSAEIAISSARAAQADIYCNLELEHANNVLKKARQNFVAGKFGSARTYAHIAKELADSTMTLAIIKKAQTQTEAENAIKYCEQKMAALYNLISRAETLGINGDQLSIASSRFYELERTLLELIDKNREGQFLEVLEQSKQLIESASLTTYELIKLIGDSRKRVAVNIL